MTARPQPEGYLITEKDITAYCIAVVNSDCDLFDRITDSIRIRSRPHTPTPLEQCLYWGTKEGKCVCSLLIPEPDLYTELTEHIRKDGREKVLEEAIKAIEKRIAGIFEAYRGETNEKLTELPYAGANGMGECITILKELRKNQGDRKS